MSCLERRKQLRVSGADVTPPIPRKMVVPLGAASLLARGSYFFYPYSMKTGKSSLSGKIKKRSGASIEKSGAPSSAGGGGRKRKRIARAVTTPNILAEVFGNLTNAIEGSLRGAGAPIELYKSSASVDCLSKVRLHVCFDFLQLTFTAFSSSIEHFSRH